MWDAAGVFGRLVIAGVVVACVSVVFPVFIDRSGDYDSAKRVAKLSKYGYALAFFLVGLAFLSPIKAVVFDQRVSDANIVSSIRGGVFCLLISLGCFGFGVKLLGRR